MTRGSICEYTEAVRGRYLRATNKEKKRILDKFTRIRHLDILGGAIYYWVRVIPWGKPARTREMSAF